MNLINITGFYEEGMAHKIEDSAFGSSWGLSNSRISLKGFENPKNRIVAKKTKPIFSRNYIHVRDQNGIDYWVSKKSLVRRFSSTPEEVALLLRLLPSAKEQLLKEKPGLLPKEPVAKPQAVPLISRDCLKQWIADRLCDKQLDQILEEASQIDVSRRNDRWIDGETLNPPLPCSFLVGVDQKGKPTVYLIGDDQIGQGVHGTVGQAIDLRSGEIVAVKTGKAQGSEARNEIAVLNELKGVQGLVKLYFSHDTGEKCYMILENCSGGSLLDQIENEDSRPDFSKKQSLSLAIGIASALKNLHEKRVAHLDLKPDNILLHSKDLEGLWHPRIGDFGCAKKLTQNQVGSEGTPSYWSPEKCAALLAPERGEIDLTKEDIWAFGLILHYLFSTNHDPLFPLFPHVPNEKPEAFIQRLREFLEETAKRPDQEHFPDVDDFDIQTLLWLIFSKSNREKLTLDRIVDYLEKVYVKQFASG